MQARCFLVCEFAFIFLWCFGFGSVKNGIYLLYRCVFGIRVGGCFGVCLSILFYFFCMCFFLCAFDVDTVDLLMFFFSYYLLFLLLTVDVNMHCRC